MSDLIDRQAAIEKLDFYMQSTRSDLECEMREDEMDFYKACYLAKKIITNLPSEQSKTQLSTEDATFDCIRRAEAIDALWKALYAYEDKTEKQFQESDELDVSDWIEHRIFVQNMSDIDRKTILALPSAQTEADLVAVVRCKDCKYNSCSPDHGNACCDTFYGMTDQMGYCHYGERRTE